MLTERKNEQSYDCPGILKDKRVLVVGLGLTGLSCVRFLYRRGIEVAVCDSRLEPPGLQSLREEYPNVPVFVGALDEMAFERADLIVASPGLSVTAPLFAKAREQGKAVLGDIEILANCPHPPLVSITGSNGKSTVTMLVGEMMRLAGRKAFVGGNIGIPALDLLDEHADADYFVLELSSFQLETTYSLHSAASVVLNISEDHMDRYPSLQVYAQAKAAIYRNADHCIFNADDPQVTAMAPAQAAGTVQWRFTLAEPRSDREFGLHPSDDHELWLSRGERRLLPASQLRIKGRHNMANALAALALGSAVNLPMPAMLEALRGFGGLPHRSQWVREYDGVNWYNDSKATNVGAALAAIEGIEANRLIVILGGQGKGQDFTALNAPLQIRARHVLLIGEDAGRIQQVLSPEIAQTRVGSLTEAVKLARTLAQPGDAVLLSPACASFDMFRDYQHRGEAFIQAVSEELS